MNVDEFIEIRERIYDLKTSSSSNMIRKELWITYLNVLFPFLLTTQTRSNGFDTLSVLTACSMRCSCHRFLYASPQSSYMLCLDEPAPEFTADTNKGKISLSDFRGRWVMLFAYPADFTPICEADITGFAKNKPAFDELGVQLIGWSVDTVESHEKWVSEVKELTKVQIEYPLIADVDKKLAATYDILHKTRGVTYRGVFVIDPEGILRFSATYPLDVGRSTKEVERIIKVLQRARELNHLDDLDRARELRKYNSRGLQYLEGLDPLEESRRILEAGKENGVTLRLIGGLAIRLHCHGKHSAHLREYRDIDYYGLRKQFKQIHAVFEKLGYSPNFEFNRLYTRSGRLQFIKRENGGSVDIFLDKVRMQHTLDFSERLLSDDATIQITDLLLSKLQITQLDTKDLTDIIAVLEDHEIGQIDEPELLNTNYLAELCSRRWGLYRTVTHNLQIVRKFIENDLAVQCIGMEASELVSKVDAILDSLTSRKKGLRWRARSVLGERVKWYEEVEIGEFESARTRPTSQNLVTVTSSH